MARMGGGKPVTQDVDEAGEAAKAAFNDFIDALKAKALVKRGALNPQADLSRKFEVGKQEKDDGRKA